MSEARTIECKKDRCGQTESKNKAASVSKIPILLKYSSGAVILFFAMLWLGKSLFAVGGKALFCGLSLLELSGLCALIMTFLGSSILSAMSRGQRGKIYVCGAMAAFFMGAFGSLIAN